MIATIVHIRQPATCAWCSRRAHPGSVRSAKTFRELIGGGYECKDNVACAERMRKAGR